MIYTPLKAVIRKVNSDETQAWMFVLNFNPIIKSLAVDPLEQNVYIASYTSTMNTARMNAANGNIIDGQTQ